MKKIIIYALLVMALFTSCDRSKIDIPEMNKGDEYSAKLGIFQNNISVTDQENSGKGISLNTGDVIAIKIVEDKVDGEVIASGLFEGNFDFSQLKVTLKHGVKYIVESTMVKDGVKTKKEDGAFLPPFNKQVSITDADAWTSSNKSNFISLSKSINVENGYEVGDRWYYYKKITGDYNSPKINIKLRRVSFKLKFIYNNLCTSLNYKVVYKVSNSSSTGVFCESTKECAIVLPAIAEVYKAIISYGEAESSVIYYFQFEVRDGTGKVIDTSKPKALLAFKANKQYTLTCNCDTKSDVSVSIGINTGWYDAINK